MKHYLLSEVVEPQNKEMNIWVGYEQQELFSSYPLHDHNFYELTYMSDGECVQIINEHVYYVKKGDIFITSPRDSHQHFPITKFCPFHCSFIDHAALSFFPPQSSFPIVLSLDEQSQIIIEQICYLLKEEYSNNRSYRQLALWHYLDSIFLIIQRNLKNPSMEKWEKTLLYVTNHLKDANFEEAVSISGYSSSHFCRMFKRDFSMTFTDFVVNMRIQQAKVFLINSSDSISEIYEKCGYKSNQRFFYDFKRLVGVTPMQYRNQKKSSTMTDLKD